MEQSQPTPKHKGGANDHLANERTFLAWIRTSIAIMAFGFVVVKFALFVQQAALVMGNSETLPDQRNSAAVGIFLVVLGAVVSLLAFFRYRRIEQQLHQQAYYLSRTLSIVLTAAILVCSALLVWYLVPRI